MFIIYNIVWDWHWFGLMIILGTQMFVYFGKDLILLVDVSDKPSFWNIKILFTFMITFRDYKYLLLL